MSAKGDARTERQSSWPSLPGSVRAARLARGARSVGLAFAGFVLLHLACQAYRAGTQGAIPAPGIEQQPGVVLAILLLVWLPFLVLARYELSRLPSRSRAAHGQARALASVEALALLVVLLFVLVHGAHFAWPLLSGRMVAEDVRPELVALLSGTWRGLPMTAIGYLSAVGAASFYAARQALSAFPGARPALVRGLLALAVLAYLLGSYAVIRDASGTILP